MNPVMTPYAAGWKRGWTEFRHSMSSPSDIAGYLFPTGIAMVVILFLRDVDLGGGAVSLGAMSLPSLLGMNIAFGGFMGAVGTLITEREDGTLLRAKAIPNGMIGYLIGKIISNSAFIAAGMVVVLIAGLMMFDGVALDGPASVLMLIAVLVLGLFASMPIGAVLGSLITNPRNMGLVMLPIMGVIAVSGIFYPITALPTWLQWIGQAFPFYWLGLGMRSALLPDGAVVLEIGESWRHLETIAALGLWTALGLILAPPVLRRMARRESGSAVAARRERAMQIVR
ncbi:MAG: ABC transporter permease [Stackebrandtia sp.]